MKAYLFSLFCAVLLVTLCGMLSPEGNLAKVFKLFTSLFLICVIVLPLPNLLESIPNLLDSVEIPEADVRFEETLNESSHAYVESLLKDTLCEQFSIPSDQIRVKIHWEAPDSQTPADVSILLSGRAIWKDPSEIEDYVQNLLRCDVQIAVE